MRTIITGPAAIVAGAAVICVRLTAARRPIWPKPPRRGSIGCSRSSGHGDEQVLVMAQEHDRRALDILASEVSELMWRVHRAQEMIRQVERADDTQALINFAALAQFARPECLPTFERRIPGGGVPPAHPRRPLPQGIPSPRRSPEVR